MPVVTPQQYQAQEPNTALRATRATIEQALARDGVVLIDVRSPQEFSGELLGPANLPQEGGAARRSHPRCRQCALEHRRG
jgi:thiosulfate/3-mercaptopyruvate sulfurtransferase